MIIRSPRMPLGVVLATLLSCSACTAEKMAITQTPNPAIVDGVYSSTEHLLPIYFDLNRSALPAQAQETLRTNAEWLKNQPPVLVRIIGFADSRGSVARNERLAKRRAETLASAYVREGIDPQRISITTRGAEAPACEPVNENCLAKSRRCETLIEDKYIAKR